MKVYWHDAQLKHAPGFFLARGKVRANFEVPARAEALLAACRSMNLDVVTPRPARRAALLTVHDATYLDFLRDSHAAWSALQDASGEVVANSHPSQDMLTGGARMPGHVIGQAGWFTNDAACPIGPQTWDAAIWAAACALAAAEEAAAGRSAYALARPPGHHAYRARAGGHCYINNAALAVERLRASGATRVAVLDIDSHHGNGTQGIFWDRADVLFVSLHGDPNRYYPWFTGHAEERGAGAGEGATLNFPLAIGTGDDGWLAALRDGLTAIRGFHPDALVVSLGFDASEHEPLNALAVTADGFARAGQAIGGLTVPTAIVQEGGYHVSLLGPLLTRFLDGFGR
ncbi:MAG: histone deacetylase family protein [Acetobacteraceae bacterium]|nr:histone deacetylase family protein [Acetobacteraceae bacterium]